MRQVCKICGKEFKDGDKVKAVVLSVYRQISSSVAYAIEKPYDCLSLEHIECADLDDDPA
jgi:hypothetical protein